MNNKLLFIALATFTIGINAADFGPSAKELAVAEFGITEAVVKNPVLHSITLPPRMQDLDFLGDTVEELQSKAFQVSSDKKVRAAFSNLKATSVSAAQAKLIALRAIQKKCLEQTNVLKSFHRKVELTDEQLRFFCLGQYAIRAGLLVKKSLLERV
jgi:hypothetical protein